MATITLSVPDEFKKLIDKHPSIKWSDIFRKMIIYSKPIHLI